jgi:N6-L-threonylcarbamoyladenine synthase
VADVCASFQATAVKMLVRKTIRAARGAGVRRLLLTGGVAANRALREALEVECAERGYRWTAPPARLCTDNAAMIAAAGAARLGAGERADLGLNAHATLALA